MCTVSRLIVDLDLASSTHNYTTNVALNGIYSCDSSISELIHGADFGSMQMNCSNLSDTPLHAFNLHTGRWKKKLYTDMYAVGMIN